MHWTSWVNSNNGIILGCLHAICRAMELRKRRRVLWINGTTHTHTHTNYKDVPDAFPYIDTILIHSIAHPGYTLLYIDEPNSKSSSDIFINEFSLKLKTTIVCFCHSFYLLIFGFWCNWNHLPTNWYRIKTISFA